MLFMYNNVVAGSGGDGEAWCAMFCRCAFSFAGIFLLLCSRVHELINLKKNSMLPKNLRG